MGQSQYIDEELFDIVLGRGRGKSGGNVSAFSGNKTKKNYGSSFASYMRLVNRTPQVMVKVTGGGKIAAQVKAHIEYISRNGKLDIFSSEHDQVVDLEEAKELLENEWDVNNQRGAGKYRQTQNIMLSMAKGTDPEKVKEAAHEFAKEHFGETHSFFYVLHTDRAHPHVHILVNANSKEGRGKKLRITKDRLQSFRETFADKLRERGIEAEATRCSDRGVISNTKKIGRVYAEKEIRSWVARRHMKAAIKAVALENATGNFIENEFYSALKALAPDKERFQQKVLRPAHNNKTFQELYKQHTSSIDSDITKFLQDIENTSLYSKQGEYVSALRSLAPDAKYFDKKRASLEAAAEKNKKQKEVKPWVRKILERRRDLLRAHFLIMKNLEASGKTTEAKKVRDYLQNFPSLETEKEAYLVQARTYTFEKKRKNLKASIEYQVKVLDLQGVKVDNQVSDKEYEESKDWTARELFTERKKHLAKLERELAGLQRLNKEKSTTEKNISAERTNQKKERTMERGTPERGPGRTQQKKKDKSRGR